MSMVKSLRDFGDGVSALARSFGMFDDVRVRIDGEEVPTVISSTVFPAPNPRKAPPMPVDNVALDAYLAEFKPDDEFVPDKQAAEVVSKMGPYTFLSRTLETIPVRCDLCVRPVVRLFHFQSTTSAFKVQTCALACGKFVLGNDKVYFDIMSSLMVDPDGLDSFKSGDRTIIKESRDVLLFTDLQFWTDAAERVYIPDIVKSIALQWREKGRVSDKQRGVILSFIEECKDKVARPHLRGRS